MDMTKIFQLELFVKEMKLWEMSANGPHNEISMEVTVFDCKVVPIKGNKGKKDTMGSGQNFLFTLNEMPTDENQAFFNIFRYTNKKKLVGSGKIPIHDLFHYVFWETFKAIEIVQQPQDGGNDHSTADATEDTNKNTAKNNSKTAQQDPENNSKISQQGTKNYSKTAQPNQQLDTKNNATKNDSKITSPLFPMSRLTKDIYPIIGTDSNQCGVVCILMRLTSFGSFTAHPIHIHQNHKEIIIQNTENTALYRRVPLDELRNNRHSEEFRFISAFPSNTGREELVYNRRPEMKDINYQCNEIDILKDILQRKSLEDQEKM